MNVTNASFSFVVSTLFAVALSAGQSPPVRVNFEIGASHLTEHEPIWITASLVNATDFPAILNLGKAGKGNFKVVVEHGGTSLDVTRPKIVNGGAFEASPEAELQPGETIRIRFLLNELLLDPAPGHYGITAAFAGSAIINNARAPVEGQERFELTVIPKDINVLRETCAKILADMTNANDRYIDLRDGAVALEYVRDPIAVPYLDAALSRFPIAVQYLAEGLQEIGTLEAVSALTARLDSPNPSIQVAVRTALYAVHDRSHDQQLKELIQTALTRFPAPRLD